MISDASLAVAEARLSDRQEVHELMHRWLAATMRVPAEELEPSRSFDEYGLDSIDAILATDELGKWLGLDLAPEFLMKHRTLDEAVDAVLAIMKEQTYTKAAGGIPLIIFPGGGGRDSDGRIHRLSLRCLPDVVCHFVALGHWREWVTSAPDFSQMIDRCCDQVAANCPHGPVRLAGYSQGCQIAFATAVALRERGREVETLMLLDGPREPYQAPRDLGRWATDWLRQLAYLAVHLLHGALRFALGRRSRWSFKYNDFHLLLVSDCVRRFHRRIPINLSKFLYRIVKAIVSERGAVTLDHLIQSQLFDQMWSHWERESKGALGCDVDVFLFRADRDRAEDLGWSSFCERLHIHWMEGDHHTMFSERNIDFLAREIVAAACHGEQKLSAAC